MLARVKGEDLGRADRDLDAKSKIEPLTPLFARIVLKTSLTVAMPQHQPRNPGL
jgi:hypothetical protein